MGAMFVLIYVLFALVSLVVAIFVNIYIATEFQNIAMMKGHNSKKYFWIPFLLGVVGYLMVIALPDRYATKRSRNNNLPYM